VHRHRGSPTEPPDRPDRWASASPNKFEELVGDRRSRVGNRRINRALHIMAVVQLRHPGTDGRRYYDRRVAEGKTPMEAMRALKRRLSDVIYRQLVNDQKQQKDGEDMRDTEARRTGPEGHLGTTTKSSAAGSNPNADASDKSLSEPVNIDATPAPGPSPDHTSTRSPSL
jgi:transposase